MKVKTTEISITTIAEGADRQVYKITVGDQNMVAITTTDAVTVLGKPRGNVKYRGQISTAIAEFFLNATDDIVPNFLISTGQYLPMNMLLGEYCRPIPVKFAVQRGTDGPQMTTEVKLSESEYAPITEDAIVDCGYLTADDLLFVRERCFELLNRCAFLTAKVELQMTEAEFEFGWDSRGKLMLTEITLNPAMNIPSEILSAWIRRQAEKRGMHTDDVELTAKVRNEAYYSYAEIYRQLFEFSFSPAKLPNNPLRVLERYIAQNYE